MIGLEKHIILNRVRNYQVHVNRPLILEVNDKQVEGWKDGRKLDNKIIKEMRPSNVNSHFFENCDHHWRQMDVFYKHIKTISTKSMKHSVEIFKESANWSYNRKIIH
jgi:pantothenate kinase-related protein Tda10